MKSSQRGHEIRVHSLLMDPQLPVYEAWIFEVKTEHKMHCEFCGTLLQLVREGAIDDRRCPQCSANSKRPSECPIASLVYRAEEISPPRRITSLPGQLELF